MIFILSFLVLFRKKVYLNILRALPRDYPKEYELEADVVSPNFYQGTKLDVNEDDVDDQSDNDNACQYVSPIRQTTFMPGFAQFAITPSRKKRKDYA